MGKASGYDDYSLFLINSGAEANENALKLASFHNGKKRVIAFKHAFHGRTSAAVRVTDNPKIIAPVNEDLAVTYLPLNDAAAVEAELQKGGRFFGYYRRYSRRGRHPVANRFLYAGTARLVYEI